jgi:ankyrin repeat protein
MKEASPLILACYRGNTEVAKYLIDNVKDLNYVSPEGTALSSLCINYNKELVKKCCPKMLTLIFRTLLEIRLFCGL